MEKELVHVKIKQACCIGGVDYALGNHFIDAAVLKSDGYVEVLVNAGLIEEIVPVEAAELDYRNNPPPPKSVPASPVQPVEVEEVMDGQDPEMEEHDEEDESEEEHEDGEEHEEMPAEEGSEPKKKKKKKKHGK